MSEGLPLVKGDIDVAMGAIARDIKVNLRRAKEFKEWLDGKQDSELTALGWTAGEVADIKSAFADAAQLNNIFEGTVNLSVAKDFRLFLKRIWGVGGAY